jgi:Na+-driven multidrug efflux pump
MIVYFIGLPANVIYNFGAAILRSFGDTKRPLYILTITGFINVGLNLLFVVLFKMDVAGVALATAVAQTISAICILRILFNPKDAYKLSFKALRFHKDSLLTIIKIGVPNGINGILFSLSNLVVQASINSFQDTAIIAGKTAATDAANIIYQVIHAFAQACVSFAGQCAGAKNYKRIDQLAIKAILSCGAIVAALSLLATLFPGFVIGIFNDSPDVLATGTNILLIMSWSYLIYVISDIYISCTRGIGKSLGVTIMNIIGIILPRLLWIWFVFPQNRTMEFLFICYPVSYVVSSIVQILYYVRLRRKLDKHPALEVA